MMPRKKTPINDSFTFLGIFNPVIIQTGMARTRRSVMMVMMAVETEKVKALMHLASLISLRSQAPEIGRH